MKKLLVLLFACALSLQAQNWFSVSSGLTGDIWGIDYVDANNVWICASNGQVARSTNGGSTWTLAGNAGEGAYGIAALSATTAVVVLGPTSGDGKIMRTTDGGTSWAQVYTATGAWFNFVDNVSSTVLWALSDPIGGNFHLVKSTDGGATWALAPNLPVQPATNVFGANGSFYRIGNTCWFGAGGSGATLANRVYKSTNGPDGPWTFSNTTVQYPGTIAFSTATGAGITGHWQQTTLVNRSTDGGGTWAAQTTAIGTVNGLDYVQGTPWAWASTSSGIWKTSDNGVTWVSDQTATNMLVVRFFGDANVGLAGQAGGGLYKSNHQPVTPVELTSFTASTANNSVTLRWNTATEINNRIFEIERKTVDNDFVTVGFVNGQGTTTQAHDYTYSDNNLNPGTYIYRLKQIDYDGQFSYSDEVTAEISAAIAFELNQNYPNPFNPSTTINFGVAQAGNVRLVIYNSLGQEVTTLVNGYKDAGSYDVVFDASNLSSGVYVYKLETPNFVSIKKMILNK